MKPPRSERRWWKDDYTGTWYPEYDTNDVLSKHVDERKAFHTRRKVSA